jgi:hypothetical protein
MHAQPWRERREAYLRARGQLADLFREGYTESGLSVIQGGAVPALAPHPTLILVTRSEKKASPSNRTGFPAGEPAAGISRRGARQGIVSGRVGLVPGR